MKPFINIMIQFLWVALCLFVGYEVSVCLCSTSSFVIRWIVTGVTMIITYSILAIITNIIKATKDPIIQDAAQFGITLSQYKKFQALFDMLLLDEVMSDDRLRELLHEVLIEKPKEWGKYCISRKDEYKPFYHLGKEVFIRNENNKYIRGVITDISFGIEWWNYTIKFSKPISINNSYPSEIQKVLAKTIMDIETKDIQCDDCHYKF